MTNEQIRKMAPGETLWDDVIRGLHVVARANGKKNFYFFYRTKAGQQRKPKIGQWSTEFPVADARRIARGMVGEISLGGDPKGEVRKSKDEMTIHELFELTVKQHWSKPRFVKSGHLTDIQGLYRNHLQPTFGGLKVSQLDVRTIKAWHSKYAQKKSTTGNRALEVLSRMLNEAEAEDILDVGSNPCQRVHGHPERKRKTRATVQELQQILTILEREAPNHPAGVVFIYLMMFTGSRPTALERATWDRLEVVKKDGEFYGHLAFDGKSTAETGDEEQIVIPPNVMAILGRLPMIPGRPILGIKSPRRLWLKIQAEIGRPDLWLRDLRRSFGSVARNRGVSLDDIGESLNHASSETTRIYALLDIESRIKVVDSVQNAILTSKTQ